MSKFKEHIISNVCKRITLIPNEIYLIIKSSGESMYSIEAVFININDATRYMVDVAFDDPPLDNYLFHKCFQHFSFCNRKKLDKNELCIISAFSDYLLCSISLQMNYDDFSARKKHF